MKTTILKVTCIALCFLSVILLFKSCKQTDRASYWKGIADSQAVTIESLGRLNQEMRDEHQTAIAQLNQSILDHKSTIDTLTEAEIVAERALESLESEATSLKSQVRDLNVANSLIVNLEGQVNIWKERFTLAEKIIVEKDGIIFDLTNKYDIAEKRIVFLEGFIDQQNIYIDTLKKNFRICENQRSALRLTGTAKTLVILVATGVAGYLVLK